MNSNQADVLDFHRVMGIPASPKPAMLTPERAKLRMGLIDEEAGELAEALGLTWCPDDGWIGSGETPDMVKAIDAVCDLLYVTYGTAVELGVDLQPFWRRVHASNMKKAGGPVREDGKILKPEGWQPPDIAAEFEIIYGHKP